MPRVVSFIVLLAVIILIGSMFFQVIVQFIVPLFLAGVLVVIFKPLHLWVMKKCRHRIKLSAAVTTLLIVLIVLLPIGGMFIRAVAEGAQLYSTFSQDTDSTETAQDTDQLDTAESAAHVVDISSMHVVIDRMIPHLNALLQKFRLDELGEANVEHIHKSVNETLKRAAAPLALGGMRALVGTLVGLAIMVLTLYYFFADGPNMIAGLMRLSPLDDAYEQELLDKFSDVSRSVVVAVLLSAIVQGMLAGIGYFFAGVENVFFLTVATCFLAMVPFVGAAAVWSPVCLFLYFYVGDTTAAIVLAVYCAMVVSMIDNLIKPLVLHGQANLHPLLALLSVIGGIQALGPIGILVGPMLVAFLQALLNMLNKELTLLGKESDTTGRPVVFATADASTASTTQLPKKNPNEKKK
ncbi:MAG: AI-2E family transporter [Pirellulales bacterium]|nr:AI-2E family transporter [Pirellulales bacterium]